MKNLKELLDDPELIRRAAERSNKDQLIVHFKSELIKRLILINEYYLSQHNIQAIEVVNQIINMIREIDI